MKAVLAGGNVVLHWADILPSEVSGLHAHMAGVMSGLHMLTSLPLRSILIFKNMTLSVQ